MDISRYIEKLKKSVNGKAKVLAQFDTETTTPPVEPPVPAPTVEPAPTPAPKITPAPQQEVLPPEVTGRIFEVVVNPWKKSFFNAKTKKREWRTIGYYVNVKGVEPTSEVGMYLEHAGFKFKKSAKHGDNYSIGPLKTEEAIRNVDGLLEGVAAKTGSQFTKDWLNQIEGALGFGEIEVDETGDMGKIVDSIFGSNATEEAKEEALRKHVRAKLDELSNLTDEAAKNELIIQLLASRDKFHRYSFFNTFLMILQNPDVSSYVTGGKKWENNFGRKVREGEKPMEIFAPKSLSIYKASVKKLINGLMDIQQMMGPNAPIGSADDIIRALKMKPNDYVAVYLRDAVNRTEGNRISDLTKTMGDDIDAAKGKSIYFGISKNKFKIVEVYDIDQTDPVSPDAFKPPTPEELEWQAKNQPDDKAMVLMGGLYDWAENNAKYKVGTDWKKGIKVDLLKQMDPSLGGWSSGAETAVNSMSEGWRQFSTGVHEVAHTLLHWGDDRSQMTRKQKEIEAESVAFIVLSYFGYTDTRFAANYLALKKATSQDVLDRYEKIDIASRQIINGIERSLKQEGKTANWFKRIKIAAYLQ